MLYRNNKNQERAWLMIVIFISAVAVMLEVGCLELPTANAADRGDIQTYEEAERWWFVDADSGYLDTSAIKLVLSVPLDGLGQYNGIADSDSGPYWPATFTKHLAGCNIFRVALKFALYGVGDSSGADSGYWKYRDVDGAGPMTTASGSNIFIDDDAANSTFYPDYRMTTQTSDDGWIIHNLLVPIGRGYLDYYLRSWAVMGDSSGYIIRHYSGTVR